MCKLYKVMCGKWLQWLKSYKRKPRRRPWQRMLSKVFSKTCLQSIRQFKTTFKSCSQQPKQTTQIFKISPITRQRFLLTFKTCKKMRESSPWKWLTWDGRFKNGHLPPKRCMEKFKNFSQWCKHSREILHENIWRLKLCRAMFKICLWSHRRIRLTFKNGLRRQIRCR